MPSDPEQSLIMYLVMRRDLLDELKWPLGALVTQGCHAATAVLWEHQYDENVKEYTKHLDSMRKVTLQVNNDNALRTVADKLKTANIDYKLWIEQPENIATCIAVKPLPKSIIHPLLKSLKLFA